MGNTVTVTKNGSNEQFIDVLGHQIGNGCIQVLQRDGTQRIIFSPDDVFIELDDEGSKKFTDDLVKMETEAEAPPQKVAEDVTEQTTEKEDNSPALTSVKH